MGTTSAVGEAGGGGSSAERSVRLRAEVGSRTLCLLWRSLLVAIIAGQKLGGFPQSGTTRANGALCRRHEYGSNELCPWQSLQNDEKDGWAQTLK
ncbi:hypothetical protein DPV78_011628 [Talaromyces pinophilus]|nr:hypothetical protein DPV78_011628 [Talaromyces pinophilus]